MADCAELLMQMEERHAAERAEWAKERQQLLNAALAQNTGEFVMRQRATGLDPIVDKLPTPKPLHDGETVEVEGKKHPLVY